jgi:phospholipase/carboxylesterase
MKNTKTIIGYTKMPLSGKKPRGLLVLLHGYGGNGHHLFRALSSLREQFPDFAIALPDGPIELNINVHAWIKLSFPIVEEQLWNGAVETAPLLEGYITKELQNLGLKENQLILLGFSQGSIMSLHVGLRLKSAPMAIIALSGFLVGAEKLGSITSRPPVYLINGDIDTVVMPSEVIKTKQALENSGIEVHHKIIKRVGHVIDQTVLETIVTIINQLTEGKSLKEKES